MIANSLTTPRRAATRIALHACAIPHQREIAALAAHLAFVAFCLGFRPAFGLAWGDRRGGAAGLAPLQGFQLFRRRQVVARFLLQRDCAFRASAARALGPWEAIAVTLPEPRASTSTPRITTRLSERERVQAPETGPCGIRQPILLLARDDLDLAVDAVDDVEGPLEHLAFVLGNRAVFAFGQHDARKRADRFLDESPPGVITDHAVLASASPPRSLTSFSVITAARWLTVTSVSLPAWTRMSERTTELASP